ncbi:hypothetical protein CDAR_399941 [Caerostris darwini]|uniref:Uncharacterized protein n=1 Tax=Caerostris darwini TaxID=1538125 RepID=A0AAV4S5B5_9ARAC|nr:hypothetical protein CDAR_399941 [Caerostris darwini]
MGRCYFRSGDERFLDCLVDVRCFLGLERFGRNLTSSVPEIWLKVRQQQNSFHFSDVKSECNFAVWVFSLNRKRN